MPDHGTWGTAYGFTDKKWDPDEFFGEMKRLSGLPVKESAADLDWSKLNALASVLSQMGSDLKLMVEHRDATGTGFLARKTKEFCENLIKEVGPYLANEDMDPSKALIPGDQSPPDWKELRVASEMIRALSNTLTAAVNDKDMRSTKTETNSLRERVNDVWRGVQRYE